MKKLVSVVAILGAGMSKLNKGTAWVQSNMPFGQGGSLSDQEAADVMLYVNAQES